jgi:hypothetical protein
MASLLAAKMATPSVTATDVNQEAESERDSGEKTVTKATSKWLARQWGHVGQT